MAGEGSGLPGVPVGEGDQMLPDQVTCSTCQHYQPKKRGDLCKKKKGSLLQNIGFGMFAEITYSGLGLSEVDEDDQGQVVVLKNCPLYQRKA